MHLNWNTTDQFYIMIDNSFFIPLYKKTESLAKESSAIRFAAPIITLIDETASIVQLAGLIGESTIKGLANLSSGDFRIGTAQLIASPILGIGMIPTVLIRPIFIFLGMLLAPEETSSALVKTKEDGQIPPPQFPLYQGPIAELTQRG